MSLSRKKDCGQTKTVPQKDHGQTTDVKNEQHIGADLNREKSRLPKYTLKRMHMTSYQPY